MVTISLSDNCDYVPTFYPCCAVGFDSTVVLGCTHESSVRFDVKRMPANTISQCDASGNIVSH